MEKAKPNQGQESNGTKRAFNQRPVLKSGLAMSLVAGGVYDLNSGKVVPVDLSVGSS